MKFGKIAVMLLLAMSFCIKSYGQIDKKKQKQDLKNLEFYNAIIGTNDKNFDVTSAPEAWKDESFVFLGISTYITVGTKGDKYRGINRKRVLLQDKSAVEKFAEFYFQNSETTVLTVVKKNGTEINIDLKEAIKVTTDVPSYYAGRFQSSESSKLAIPNLEIGDILDYTSIYNDTYNGRISYSDVLSASEPVLYQSLIFDVRSDFDIYKNTFNTIAKFKFLKGKGHDYNGKLDDDVNRFELEVEGLEAQKDEPFSSTLDNEPLVKFMAIPSADRIFHSGKDPGLIRDNLVLDDLVRQVFKYNGESSVFFNQLVTMIKPKIAALKLKDPKKIADACYYYLRDYLMMMAYGPETAVNSVNNYGYTYEKIYHGYNNAIDENAFLSSFGTLLYKFYVDAEVVGVVSKVFGEPSDAVTHGEVYFGMYVPAAKSYYWPPERDRTTVDTPGILLSGAKGKAINILDVDKKIKAKDIEIPATSSDNNKEDNTLKVKIDADNNIVVSQKTLNTGFLKANYFGLIEQFGDDLYTDFLSMYEDEETRIKLEEYEKKLEKNKGGVYQNFLDKSDKNFSENVEKWIEEKERKVTLDSFELISSGRTSLKPAHEIEVNFKSDGIVKKIGPNLFFDIGALIGGQVQIEEKYKTNRITNIDLGKPRIFQYAFEIELPEGYRAEGIENLVKSKENTYCSFVSTAVLEGNLLKVTTAKNYKQQFAPKEAWTSINEVLDEAYKFSQEKIVLKKK